MYFVAVYSVVPFGNHPKSDVNRTCLFLNLQVITAVDFEMMFVFCGFMTFNVLYSHISEGIQYVTRRKDQKKKKIICYLLDSHFRTK
jgi:L-arabinose isomerase